MHNQELVLNILLIIAIILIAINVIVFFYMKNITDRIGRKEDTGKKNDNDTKNDKKNGDEI